MRRCITAVGSLDVRALVTLGPSLDAGRFGSPPNVRLERFVPHSAVLPQAVAMVSQCGPGTVTKAPNRWIPLVCVPLVGDQPDNAARIVARGAGLRLAPDAAPERIAEAVRRVAQEPPFRAAAARLGAAMEAKQAAAWRAAAEIEAVLRSPRRVSATERESGDRQGRAGRAGFGHPPRRRGAAGLGHPKARP